MRPIVLTMEETIVITWLGAYLGGALLAFIISWIEDKTKDKD